MRATSCAELLWTVKLFICNICYACRCRVSRIAHDPTQQDCLYYPTMEAAAVGSERKFTYVIISK